MSVEKMRLVTIESAVENIDKASLMCLYSGCFQPQNASDFISSGMHGIEKFEEDNPYKQAFDKITDFLKMAGITPHFVNQDETVSDIEQINSRFNEALVELDNLQKRRTELVRQIEEAKDATEQLEHFKKVDVDLDKLFKCEFIKIRFGSIPAEGYKMLDMYSDDPNVLFLPFSNDRSTYWGVYTAPAEKIDDVDIIFAMLGFNRIRVPETAGSAAEAIEHYKEIIESGEKEISEIDLKASEYRKEKESELLKMYSDLMVLSQAFEIRKYAIKKKDNFILIGWIPLKCKSEFENNLSKVGGIKLTFSDSQKENQKPPILLKNPRLFKSYEFYVKMFGVPGYGEIDPTIFIAVTYTLLFGIMFADVGQGIVLSIVGWLMYKIKKMDLGRLLIPCGISSAIFGLVFGSVFGSEEGLNPLYRAIGFKNGKPINVLDSNNTMTILIAAIGLGVVLLIIAMILGIYSKLKQKRPGDALFSSGGLTGLVLYLGILLLALNLVAGLNISNIIPILMIVAGVVCLWLSEPLSKLVNGDPNWQPESWGGYLIQGFFEVFEGLLSFLTNTVSFLRVGAFVLVHASMMMVFFNLAAMIGPPGSVGYIIMIVFGNVFVIALEGLLVGVQSLRLEFYEMFSRFYDGSGKEFCPIAFTRTQNNKQKTVKGTL